MAHKLLKLSTDVAAGDQVWNKTKVIDTDVWIWAGGSCLKDNKINQWLTSNSYIFML